MIRIFQGVLIFAVLLTGVVGFSSDASASQFVVTSAVNYRTGPGKSYPRLGTLQRGTMVYVTANYGGWYEIALQGGAKGYVYSRYLAPANNVGGSRQGPATSGRDMYGSVAYSPNSGQYAFSYNHTSKGAADRTAIRDCGGGDCYVLGWVKNACLSIASDGYDLVAADWGSNRRQAGQKAVNRCGYGCDVLDTICTD